nr:MAG TPA: hypothetical protein [Caudoviricetes sp.]
MGVKLMTGATGEQNIQAADDRECLAGITGLDSYVFPTGSQLKATLVDANTVTIGTGAGSLQGSRFRCSTTTTVNIQSGTQGQFRHDIVGLHFSRETSGLEGLEFQVLTGEPATSEGAAEDPAYTAGDLLKGDVEAFMPLYRVRLSGINASDPEQLFSVLTPLSTFSNIISPNAWHTAQLKAPTGWSISSSSNTRNQISAYPLLGMVEIVGIFTRAADSTIPTTTICNLNDVGMSAYKPARDLSIPNIIITSGTGNSAQYKQTNIVIKTNGDIIIGSSQVGRSIAIWTGLFSLAVLH